MPLAGCPHRFREPSSTVVSHAWTPELVLVFSSHLRGPWRGDPGTPHHSCVCFCFRSHSPCVVVPTLCQGRDAQVKMNIKQWTDTCIRWGRFITITWGRLQLLHFYWQSPTSPPRWDQGSIQGCVYLANTLPDSLQGGPPLSGLSLLLAPEGGGQGGEEQGHLCSVGWHWGPEAPQRLQGTQAAAQASHINYLSSPKDQYVSYLTQFPRAQHHDFHRSCQDNLLNRGMDATTRSFTQSQNLPCPTHSHFLKTHSHHIQALLSLEQVPNNNH